MNVLVIHRSPVIAKGLKLLIESSGERASVHDWQTQDSFKVAPDQVSPDLVLIDPEIVGMDSDRLAAIVADWKDSAAVAVISMEESASHIEEAVNSGAQGYVSLNSGDDEFIGSLRLLAEGNVVATGPEVETLADVVSEMQLPSNGTSSLTPREREIAVLVAEGLTNRELAARVYLTEGTVKVHLRNIFRKLGMVNRAELAVHAHRTGIVA